MSPPSSPPPFRWTERAGTPMLVCDAIGQVHGWTTRNLELGQLTDADPGWSRLAAAAGVRFDRVAYLRQVHGRTVIEASTGSRVNGTAGDALISRDPDAVLTVRVADCVPLLIADPVSGAVAAVHAGWRGTCASIARAAVEATSERFGSSPSTLVAAIGPSIGPCCYETGPAVREALAEAGWPAAVVEEWFEGPARRHLNLWRANRAQLLAAGLQDAHVFTAGLCTRCHADWFHSYRRDGAQAGRTAAFIRAAAAR